MGIVVVLILAAGMAGIFLWKRSENDDIIDKVNESLMEEQL